MTLVRRVFLATVARLLTQDGIDEMLRYSDGEAFLERAWHHRILVATPADDPSRFVGIAETRDDRHLSLLFVDRAFQGQGLARLLVDAAIALCRERRPSLDNLTVNSSPNSVGVYERLGFRPTDVEQLVKGVRFLPMVLELRASTP